jgi:hypothetical protein
MNGMIDPARIKGILADIGHSSDKHARRMSPTYDMFEAPLQNAHAGARASTRALRAA